MVELIEVEDGVYQVGERANTFDGWFFIERGSDTLWSAYQVSDPTDRYYTRVWESPKNRLRRGIIVESRFRSSLTGMR